MIKNTRKDGRMKHPAYAAWMGLKQRCYAPNSPKYHRYGGRGIIVCAEWLDDFWTFVSDVGPRPEGCTLDRIDVDGNYCKENCRWADKYTQAHNVERKLSGHLQNVSKFRPKLNLTKPWRAEVRRYGKIVVKMFKTKEEASEWLEAQTGIKYQGVNA